MKILLIGSGGREHAIAVKMLEDKSCKPRLFAASSNPAILDIAEDSLCLPNEVEKIVHFAVKNNIELVVIGPEEPLSLGLADRLREKNIPTFGPCKNAAMLETSKSFTKDICVKLGVPTAKHKAFSGFDEAIEYLRHSKYPAVLKQSGLAAGKGVVICEAFEQAEAFAKEVLNELKDELVVEEFLEGPEVSLFALSDGKDVRYFGSAHDYKRVGDGNKGENTGGMGSYAPSNILNKSPNLENAIMESIVLPVLKHFNSGENKYVGVIFAGIMLTKEGPKLLEFNARFGDPETQSLLETIDCNFVDVLYKTATENLKEAKFVPKEGVKAVTLVLTNMGYPGQYKAGELIPNASLLSIKTANEQKAGDSALKIFCSGVKKKSGTSSLSAAGGRVVCVTASSKSYQESTQKTYEMAEKIKWKNCYYRTDIGTTYDV